MVRVRRMRPSIADRAAPHRQRPWRVAAPVVSCRGRFLLVSVQVPSASGRGGGSTFRVTHPPWVGVPALGKERCLTGLLEASVGPAAGGRGNPAACGSQLRAQSWAGTLGPVSVCTRI